MLNQRPSVLVFMLVCGSVSCVKVISQNLEDVETKFIDYIAQYNKPYRFDIDEYRRRFITFKVSCALL